MRNYFVKIEVGIDIEVNNLKPDFNRLGKTNGQDKFFS